MIRFVLKLNSPGHLKRIYVYPFTAVQLTR